MFNLHSLEENNMKKLGYVFAALGAIAIAAPSIASAEDVVIKRDGDHQRFGARAMPQCPLLSNSMFTPAQSVVLAIASPFG